MFVLRVNGSLNARFKRRLSVHTSGIVVNTPVSSQPKRCTDMAGACVCVSRQTVKFATSNSVWVSV